MSDDRDAWAGVILYLGAFLTVLGYRADVLDRKREELRQEQKRQEAYRRMGMEPPPTPTPVPTPGRRSIAFFPSRSPALPGPVPMGAPPLGPPPLGPPPLGPGPPLPSGQGGDTPRAVVGEEEGKTAAAGAGEKKVGFFQPPPMMAALSKSMMQTLARVDPRTLHPSFHNKEARMLEKSLPEWATAKNFWDLMVIEMGKRHDWFSIAVVYSSVYPRPFRIALIFTATMILMYVNRGGRG
jgi:hypothetical protein